MIEVILNFLASKLGAKLAPVIAGLVAGLFAWIAAHVAWSAPYMTVENQTAFIGFVFGVVMTIINYLTTVRAWKYGKPVQRLLRTLAERFGLKTVEVDGVIANVTAASAEEIHEDVLSLPGGKFDPRVKVERAKRA